MEAASADDAHRVLGKGHDAAAILSHVEQRQVSNGYTVQYQGKLYQIDRGDIRTGMRGAKLRVERRLDGTIAMQFSGRYLRVQECDQSKPAATVAASSTPAKPRKGPNAGGKSRWMDRFFERPAPRLNKALAIANATS
ncbi:MAG: hypothetical protein JJE04_20210 [Acidobacteriia bacterium]|nr:hypothetical protein [Terriglobia bacterium]